MPLPLAPLVAAAAAIGATQNCEHDNDVEEASDASCPTTSVRFQDEPSPPNSNSSLPTSSKVSSIRSIENVSERGSVACLTGARHLGRSPRPIAVGCLPELRRGFVEGDFSTGKIEELQLDRGCFTLAFHPTEALLVVGLRGALRFYESSTYSIVYERATDDMVSAIVWHDHFLAVGSLDGTVALYRVNVDILESQGPTVLEMWAVAGEVRAVAMDLVGQLEPTLVVAVGTKAGCLVLASYRLSDVEPIDRIQVERCSSAILSVYMHQGRIAWGTKSGCVQAYRLRRNGSAAVILDQVLYQTQRDGPVRCVVFAGLHLVFGGYDKKVVMVDTALWQICRELSLQGTVNTIVFDPLERYLTVGSRDKTFRIFDTSTYACIKSFTTPGWVTGISWSPQDSNVVAVRSERTLVDILNLSPIAMTDVRLSSRHGDMSSVSWSRQGRFLARARGPLVIVADSYDGFRDVGMLEFRGGVIEVAFCPAPAKDDLLVVMDTVGHVTLVQLQMRGARPYLERLDSVMVEANMKALAWSTDGSTIMVGGRGNKLHVLLSGGLIPARESIDMEARVWDIAFVPDHIRSTTSHYVAVALGDYTVAILDESFEPCLQVVRTRTVRCLAYHPSLPLLAVGDGAATVAIVGCASEEVMIEIDVKGRANAVAFSPKGDYLLVGTDMCKFSLLECTSFQCLQEVDVPGFALAAKFSPVGTQIALGSASESYTLMNLGPFLNTDMVPLGRECDLDKLPPWVVDELLFRSNYGPSFVQRQMVAGGSENLNRVAKIMRKYPDSVYALDRTNSEGCFDTAMRLKRPNLLKVAVTALVDGTLDESEDGQKSILTTEIPRRGSESLIDFLENHPPEFVVEILEATTFMKVPFTGPQFVSKLNERPSCGSATFMDPWPTQFKRKVNRKQAKGVDEITLSGVSLTPAVLPLPGLGDLRFLSCLLMKAPPQAFDNDAMALVLKVVWRSHVRKYFVMDLCLFGTFYACWIAFLELSYSSLDSPYQKEMAWALSVAVVTINSLFFAKELVHSGFGMRERYFSSMWNTTSLLSIGCVYGYLLATIYGATVQSLVPLAVIATLLLTLKLISYLRGFSDTGWLVSVLIANFRDVRGFLLILFCILLGFSVSFRLVFGSNDYSAFSSLSRAFLATFELTILGSYDPVLLYESPYTALAAVLFVLAVTVVLVVALNALISILADSYARVQENSVANRRRERAALIVEYLTLLPKGHRRRVEKDTRWFHILLEVDAEGDLMVRKDDWEGGLNALRKDMEELCKSNHESHMKRIDQLKADIDSELAGFRDEMKGILVELKDEVKKLHALHSEGGITFSGKNVAKAVKAVKSVHQKSAMLFKHTPNKI